MNQNNQVPKFRVSLSMQELEQFITYLANDTERTLENAPLRLRLQKQLRKIQFDILEPAYLAAPEHSFVSSATLVKIAQEDKETKGAAAWNKLCDTKTHTALSNEEQDLAIFYLTEVLKQQPDCSVTQDCFNAVMNRKIFGA